MVACLLGGGVWAADELEMNFKNPPESAKPGNYDLFISVGTRDGTPQIALPITSDDGQRRYLLGKVTLEEY